MQGDRLRVVAINGLVVFHTKGDHFTGMNVREAHEHVTAVLEAINSASGFEEAMAGKVKTPDTCSRCKARNITPRHRCSKDGRFLPTPNRVKRKGGLNEIEQWGAGDDC